MHLFIQKLNQQVLSTLLPKGRCWFSVHHWSWNILFDQNSRVSLLIFICWCPYSWTEWRCRRSNHLLWGDLSRRHLMGVAFAIHFIPESFASFWQGWFWSCQWCLSRTWLELNAPAQADASQPWWAGWTYVGQRNYSYRCSLWFSWWLSPFLPLARDSQQPDFQLRDWGRCFLGHWLVEVELAPTPVASEHRRYLRNPV